jgi:hypothetical protein
MVAQALNININNGATNLICYSFLFFKTSEGAMGEINLVHISQAIVRFRPHGQAAGSLVATG